MKVKIVGYSAIRSGNFNGRDYTNRKLSYVSADEKGTPSDYKGARAGEFSIPASCMMELDKCNIGDLVNLYFDRYGKVETIVKV